MIPAQLGSLDEGSFKPSRWLGHAGIDLHEERQLAMLERWAAEFQPLFAKLRVDPAINTLAQGKPYLHNGQFPTPDAEIYASLLCDRRPKTVLEVGAGFSTLVARRAVDHGGWDCKITVVDPQPRTEVAGHADRIIRSPVEEVSTAHFELDPEGVLFVDSSHVLRARGDLPRIFNELIPGLPGGVLVHVHDVFIPWDYPDAYLLRLYGEQYLLQALLADSPRYRVLLAAHHMARSHPQHMRRAFGDVVASDPLYLGSSFWFEIV